MAGPKDRQNRSLRSAASRLAGEAQKRPFTAAAIVGGAAAATAGAFMGARALARRNGATEGHPVNAVLETAITACEAAAAAGNMERGGGAGEISAGAPPEA